MRATRIKREPTGILVVTWDDGHISYYPLAYLREECPCANCKGESLFGQTYRPPKLQLYTPGMNELDTLAPMGHYGVIASWKDGHDTGIYSWDYLRAICPCEECSKVRATMT